jgi:large subunit ribosomal protein L10
MAITREKKEELFKGAQMVAGKPSVVFVNFRGLSVGDTSAMRAKLGEQDVNYVVTKKTLVKKAFAEAGIEGELPQLDGELALAYADDATAAAREMYSFQKEYKAKVSILGGVFENKFLAKDAMEEIAQIPSLHELRGMFVNVINSPIQGFAMVVKAYADKKEA